MFWIRFVIPFGPFLYSILHLQEFFFFACTLEVVTRAKIVRNFKYFVWSNTILHKREQNVKSYLRSCRLSNSLSKSRLHFEHLAMISYYTYSCVVVQIYDKSKHLLSILPQPQPNRHTTLPIPNCIASLFSNTIMACWEWIV